MNNQNVIALPASTSFTPEQALQSALNESLTDVLIIGYDNEGELVIRSSKMSRMDALWMTEKAKQWALGGGL
jgi:hypothetical protein